MKIRTYIIDDDPFIREELHRELKSQFSETLEVNGVFDNAVEALGALKNQPPQLVFLDIQMPMMNGFELLDKLGDVPFEVIFITSYNQYAIQAIRYSALDYLLKPIDKNELRKSIERFQTITERAVMHARLENLRHNLEVKSEQEFQLIIPTKQGEHQFAAGDIIRCEADSNYTVLYLRNKKKFVASRTLSDISAMLNPEEFIRVHKTHVVHLPFVERLTVEGELVMKDGEHVPVSRRRLAEVKAILASRKN
jgi:two-component system, LytTR family, response regulator